MRILYHPRKIVPVEPFCCIDTATSDNVTLSTSSQDGSTSSIIFSTDGTKLYVTGAVNKNVYQYNLSVAWDLSTAVYSQLKYVGTEDTFPRGIYFNGDGTKMFVGGDYNNRIYSYTLSTAWDISTATYDSISFSTGSTILAIQFSNNGLKMYKSGAGHIVEYTLTVPYDISTAVYLNQNNMGVSFNIWGFWISNNGINLYLLHEPPGTIVILYQYKLNTPWHINTAIQTCVSPISLNKYANGLAFSPDGTKHYISVGTTEITQYSSCSTPVEYVDVNYGYLYNWYAAMGDADGSGSSETSIAASGWHLPTYTECDTLVAYLGGITIAGGALKEAGTAHWDSPNTGATNSSGFSARGEGYRSTTGTYSQIRITSQILNTFSATSTTTSVFVIGGNTNTNAGSYVSGDKRRNGYAVRLVKDSTTLTHGQTGIYTGNDGKIYPTICIGTQEWLATNLAETLYRNGSSITNVTDNTTWAALTTGARCSYDNDENNTINP